MTVAEAAVTLIADLAQAIGAPEIPLDKNEGWHLNLGDDDAYLYCRDGMHLLIIIPVVALPADVGWVQANALLRENMFDSAFMPFRLATDPSGMLVQWGLLRLEEMTGKSLAELLDDLARRAEMLRDMITPPTTS